MLYQIEQNTQLTKEKEKRLKILKENQNSKIWQLIYPIVLSMSFKIKAESEPFPKGKISNGRIVIRQLNSDYLVGVLSIR